MLKIHLVILKFFTVIIVQCFAKKKIITHLITLLDCVVIAIE